MAHLGGQAGAAAPARVTAMTYGFLAFMTALNVLNILDRTLVPSFANEIVRDLDLSKSEFGLLTGLAFVLLYVLASTMMGVIADSTHRPRFAAIGVGLWSILTAASGAARGFVSMAVPRVLIGVGEAIITPTALSMLADRFPARRLGFVSGVYYAGVPIGAGLAFLIASTLGPLIGWRACFVLLGAIGVALALILAVQKEVRPIPAARNAKAAVAHMWTTLPAFFRALFRSPALLLTMLGGAAAHFATGAAQFDALWWRRELGLDTHAVFMGVAFLFATVGVVGNVAGGVLGDWWQNRTGQGRTMPLAFLMCVLTPIGIWYRLSGGESELLFWIGVAAGIFQLGACYGPTYSTVQELAPEGMRATAVAACIMMINVVGLGASITLGGFLADWLEALGRARPITDMMLVMNVLSALAIPCFFFAGLRFNAERARLQGAPA